MVSGTEALHLRNSGERLHFGAVVWCCLDIGNLGIVCLEPEFPGLVY